MTATCLIDSGTMFAVASRRNVFASGACGWKSLMKEHKARRRPETEVGQQPMDKASKHVLQAGQHKAVVVDDRPPKTSSA